MKMLFRSAVIAILAATGAVAAEVPLMGMWGAGDALLALDAQGGRLQIGCTFALLAPVHPDASGRFTVDAQVQNLSVKLPEEDEAEATTRPARLSGQLASGRIELTLAVQGQAPRQVQLIVGQRGKPARCL